MSENFTVFVNRRKKATTRAELEKFSKEVSAGDHGVGAVVLTSIFCLQELITRIIQLETHNQQLKNIIKKETAVEEPETFDNQRKFDFST